MFVCNTGNGFLFLYFKLHTQRFLACLFVNSKEHHATDKTMLTNKQATNSESFGMKHQVHGIQVGPSSCLQSSYSQLVCITWSVMNSSKRNAYSWGSIAVMPRGFPKHPNIAKMHSRSLPENRNRHIIEKNSTYNANSNRYQAPKAEDTKRFQSKYESMKCTNHNFSRSNTLELPSRVPSLKNIDHSETICSCNQSTTQ